jgi:hypothetical protein
MPSRIGRSSIESIVAESGTYHVVEAATLSDSVGQLIKARYSLSIAALDDINGRPERVTSTYSHRSRSDS